MPRLLIAGAITRDHLIVPRAAVPRRTQPGGAPWHAALALARRPGLDIRVVSKAGPWSRAFTRPALEAFHVEWAGQDAGRDTVFVNQETPEGRRQALRSRAGPVRASGAGTDVAILSPLYPEDVAPGVAAGLARDGSFVALDAQGWLRGTDASGRVRLRPVDLAGLVDGAHVLKLSEREFRVLEAQGPVEHGARRLAERHRVEVVVTLADRGAVAVSEAGAWGVKGKAAAGADTTGSGDVFLAVYAVARADGQTPDAALEGAADVLGELLDRRSAGEPAVAACLRALYARAVPAWRRRTQPSPAFDRAAAALAPHLPAPVAPTVPAAVVGAAWALWTSGWPADPALSPAALRGLLEAP